MMMIGLHILVASSAIIVTKAVCVNNLAQERIYYSSSAATIQITSRYSGKTLNLTNQQRHEPESWQTNYSKDTVLISVVDANKLKPLYSDCKTPFEVLLREL